MRKLRRVAAALVCTGLLTLSTAWQSAAAAPVTAPATAPARQSATATPIKHFVFLMQGDRSFDNFFGTYPGADGIPAGACQPLALGVKSSGCVRPYELHGVSVPLLAPSASLISRQWDNGRMDGFAVAFTRQGRTGTLPMGYYDARDLPFSWAAASQYVLFDHFFAAAPYGTRLNRSYWVAAAAPSSVKVPATGYGNQPTIFDRLQQAGVSWKFYIQDYNPAQTYQMIKKNDQVAQTERVPLLDYTRFVQDPALRGHLADLSEYYRDLAAGTLPAVSYIASSTGAERTGRSLPTGQALLRNLVTQLQLSSAWSSSAFMWSYDGSGGWYDHVAPPKAADGAQLGLRVPALLISPYVRQGVVDHTVLDSSAALAFIERNWGVAPLTARDRTSPGLAGAGGAFDFSAAPRGAALVPNGTVAAKPALVRTAIIYWFYGGAAVFVLLLFGVAFATSFRRSRAALPDLVPEPDLDQPRELAAASSDSGSGAVDQ